MDKYYMKYKTPEVFSDVIMYSDGKYLTGLVFETFDAPNNRWSDKRKAQKMGLSQDADACSRKSDSSKDNTGNEPLPVFEDTVRWLDEYFGRDADGNFTLPSRWPDFTPSIKIYGLTPFREKVLNIIRTIPFGETMTYGQIAAAIAEKNPNAAASEGRSKMSAQAVGGAVGWNPICLIIPCHRVMGAGGRFTGYGGGLINKIALLDMEAAKF